MNTPQPALAIARTPIGAPAGGRVSIATTTTITVTTRPVRPVVFA